MPTFNVGDKAVFPAHGVGVIKEIEAVQMDGTDYRLYVLKILDNGMTIKVPVDNADAIGMREIIPEDVITKPPSAELRPDQKDQDSLPPYPELDAILEAYVEESMSAQDIIAQGFAPDTVRRVLRMIDGAEYKRRQGPIGVKITPRAFGRDWRLPIVNRFREK